MKKNLASLIFGSAILVASIFAWTVYSDNHQSAVSGVKSNSEIAETKNVKPAEKLQVFLFHATQRCSSCIAIGKYAKETVEQKFPEELKSGKIEFREINIDLPENKELATKFGATGSVLFINPVIDGKDNIKEDTQVWRLVSNEQGFIDYLSGKIKNLI